MKNYYKLVSVVIAGIFHMAAGCSSTGLEGADATEAMGDPTCQGDGCLPQDAACDATLPCSSSMSCVSGTCVQRSTTVRPEGSPSMKKYYTEVSDDLTIRYRVAGNGDQVILLVPGLTASGEVFERQLEHFQNSTDYTVYAMDPRGQGESTKTATGNTYEQHGRDVGAFMQALSLTDVVLAGWSNGVFDVMAYIDQNTAANLRGLILIDGTPKCSGADNTTEWVWYRRDDADGYKQYYTQGFLFDRQNLNTDFATWMVEDPTPEYLAWMECIISQTPDEVAALLNETSAYLDYSEDLAALDGQLPLLYVARTEWAPLVSDWAQQNTPSATVEALGKHMMFWERSEDFNAILDEFLVTVDNWPVSP